MVFDSVDSFGLVHKFFIECADYVFCVFFKFFQVFFDWLKFLI